MAWKTSKTIGTHNSWSTMRTLIRYIHGNSQQTKTFATTLYSQDVEFQQGQPTPKLQYISLELCSNAFDQNTKTHNANYNLQRSMYNAYTEPLFKSIL